MSHLFFVSYSRVNVKYPNDAELIRRLIDDLTADLDVQVPPGTAEEICFFDTTNIETGSDWNEDLSEAAARSRVAIALYSPSYFSSVWCGREFQVFLDRRERAVNYAKPAPVAIIPVLWIRSEPKNAAAAIQNVDNAYPHAPFPAEYAQMGLRQIMLLKLEPHYTQIRLALGARILNAVTNAGLPEMSNIDLRSYRSSWETAAPGLGPAHNVSKTCFVYLANGGWDWRPYPEPEPKVGAMAQQITGEIGLQYEEIPCDAQLPQKLIEANRRHIPALLICDPSSWAAPAIQQIMADYDNRYYLNCGLIVPWDVNSPTSDRRWHQFARNVCPQKTRVPPLNHEWTSISTSVMFRNRTLAIVEELRGRMINDVAASGINVAKAENEAVATAAEASGITVRSAPVIVNVRETATRP